MPITWLHVSDLHLVPLNSNEPFVSERTRNLDNLCIRVREEKENGAWKPELIFVTGDIANQGDEMVFKATNGTPAPASVFFDKLRDAAGLERKHLFVVPGNHDVNRKKMRGSGLKPSLDSQNELEDYFSTSEPKPHITRKLGAFAAWYDEYFSGIRTFSDRSTCMTEQVVIDTQKISLLLMNSAIFCEDSNNDSGKLLIGQGCLDPCIQNLSVPETPDLTLGLIHHPLSFLASFERSTIKESLKRHVDILLRGHTHETEVDNAEFLEMAAGAAGEKTPWPRRALYGCFDDRSVTIFPIRNSEAPHWKWTLDTGVFPEDRDSGYCRTIPLDRHDNGVLPLPTFEKEWERYQICLKRELGSLRLFGLPRGFDRIDVNLDDDTFVTLSMSWQYDIPGVSGDESDRMQQKLVRVLKPAELMHTAFAGDDRRLLVVLGDAGAGKTTLMQYYALSILDQDRARGFGFSPTVRVFFLHLRALHQQDGAYESLPESLNRWASNHGCPVEAQVFDSWLQSGPSLVLLDGLDEIIGLKERQKACRWIDNQWRNEAYGKTRFVVTTRRTGFVEIELQASCYKAFVNDFDSEQQSEFLQKWYSALLRTGLSKEECRDPEFQRYLQTEAEKFAGRIMAHLSDERYKGLRPLAAIPMVLQMMALLWHREHDLPKTREQLYRGLFEYLVLKRDDSREILESGSPITRMVPEQFRKVLGALALWMYSDENRSGEQVRSVDMHKIFRQELDALRSREFELPSLEELCSHLLNRAELLTVNDMNTIYEFRHKSFREYLAGAKLCAVDIRQPDCFDTVIVHFSDPSWEESIRFFFSGLDLFQFDHFMSRLFDPSVKPSFTQEEKLLLKLLVEEAPNRKTDALCTRLCTPKNQTEGYDAERQARQFMILDTLASIGDHAPVAILQRFLRYGYAEFDDNECESRQKVESRAREVLVELGGEVLHAGTMRQHGVGSTVRVVREGKTTLFRNPMERMAEYILIPARQDKVPDIYFGRYPVTNRLYRQFIDYLRTPASEYEELLPVLKFGPVLQDIANNKTWDKGFAKYLREGKNNLAGLFRSGCDEDRKFGGDDQPVVSITWYAARSYCLWLSLMESKGKNPDLYRLPTESEWEWAAAGKEMREYPWGSAKPSPKLANYDESNIGSTTPVGSYPEGATPEGLYDMAGNVWEWMENWYDKDKDARALRGGSWYNNSDYLRCSSRGGVNPDVRGDDFGFRVVRPGPVVEP